MEDRGRPRAALVNQSLAACGSLARTGHLKQLSTVSARWRSAMAWLVQFPLVTGFLILYTFGSMKRPVNIVVVLGLALGGGLGIAGTEVAQRNVQALFWAIDGVGLIVATALLASQFLRAGEDCVGAGFLVFSIGEAVMLSGTATTLAGSVPSFAAGTALWSAALLLTSIPRHFVIWARITGVIAAVLFAVTAARIFWGEPVLPTSAPLPLFGYPFLVLTFVGWIWELLKSDWGAVAQPAAHPFGDAGAGATSGRD